MYKYLQLLTCTCIGKLVSFSAFFLSLSPSFLSLSLSTGLPVLSSLIIQDNYPVAPDGKQPLFRLYKSSIESGVWSKQLEMLQTHKMSEIGRILFACQMLLEESKNGDTLTQQRVNHVHVQY